MLRIFRFYFFHYFLKLIHKLRPKWPCKTGHEPVWTSRPLVWLLTKICGRWYPRLVYKIHMQVPRFKFIHENRGGDHFSNKLIVVYNWIELVEFLSKPHWWAVKLIEYDSYYMSHRTSWKRVYRTVNYSSSQMEKLFM